MLVAIRCLLQHDGLASERQVTLSLADWRQTAFQFGGRTQSQNYPLRCIGRTFECAAPEQRSGLNQILFEHAVRTPVLPHFYFFAATTERIGYIDTQLGSWKEDSVQIVSFSDDRQRQEILLLMPPYSWVCGEIGTFFVEPLPARPCSARLPLAHV